MSRLRPQDAETRAQRANADFSEALARGLGVISAFDEQRRQMTLSDVARAVDLPRATVRRALATLVALGYLEADGRLFRLTPRILKLAIAYLSSDPGARASCSRFASACAARSAPPARWRCGTARRR